jgi:hypothetical protein
MMAYKYTMVQLAPSITVEAGKEQGDEAAKYLESIVNDYAKVGWEFYRIDTIGVISKSGCFGGLFGANTTATEYYVATFRAQA